MNSFSEKPQNRIHNLFPSSCTRVSIWFLLVFVLPFFFTSGYSHFSSTGIESGARLALEARHKHVQHSTQVQAQSASILWAVLHIPPSTGYFFRVILIAHRSDSWSPEVYYTLLHTVALGQTRFRAAFFTLLCQFSRQGLFPLWPEITPILSIPRWKNFSCFGCFWRLFRKQQQHSFAVSRELLHGACVDVISLFAVVARWVTKQSHSISSKAQRLHSSSFVLFVYTNYRLLPTIYLQWYALSQKRSHY